VTFDEVPPPGRGRAGAILALVLCLATVGLGLIEMSRPTTCQCEPIEPTAAELGGPWVHQALRPTAASR
jgi:hypothetical protein